MIKNIPLLLVFCMLIMQTNASNALSIETPDPYASEAEWAAKVNEVRIPMQKFDKAVSYSEQQLKEEAGEGGDASSGEANTTARSILEQMIEEEIVTQWAKKDGIKVTEEEIKKAIAEMKKKFPSSQEFHKSLANRGMTVDDLKKSVSKELIVDKVMAKKSKELAVSDEEIRKFYDRNRDLYVQKAKVHVKQILLGDQENAASVVEKLKEGERFEDLVERFSEDEETRLEGGDIGVVEEGDLPEKIEKVLFKLPSNKTSGIVETEKGFYVFKVEEKFPRKETRFDDARSNIREFLLNEKARSGYLKALESEKENATIILNEDLRYLFKGSVEK